MRAYSAPPPGKIQPALVGGYPPPSRHANSADGEIRLAVVKHEIARVLPRRTIPDGPMGRPQDDSNCAGEAGRSRADGPATHRAREAGCTPLACRPFRGLRPRSLRCRSARTAAKSQGPRSSTAGRRSYDVDLLRIVRVGVVAGRAEAASYSPCPDRVLAASGSSERRSEVRADHRHSSDRSTTGRQPAGSTG